MSKMTMRDAFLNTLFENMLTNDKIVIITADFGAPSLDRIRDKFPSRVINVGIAEQNAINISVGMALEGFVVYVYGIAPFISMRCYEQIRVNVAILSQFRKMNINIISVGIGMSYSTSGPTHHCLEDLSVIKTLPNIEIFSPSDCLIAKEYVKRSVEYNFPKYIRLDGEAVFCINSSYNIDFGFRILNKQRVNSSIALITTSYMSNKIYNSLDMFGDILLVDLFLINKYNKEELSNKLKAIDTIVTVEESFINSGGLDAEINFNFKDKKIINLGLNKQYCLEVGKREYLHKKTGIDLINIKNIIKELK
ncbi:transketolase [Campylobacter coli]|nr:transketolase [Campylobacter coli]EDJ8727300.1 transketolase [Campylobacter coli]EHR2170000.1 transketolase [Campylobacter coli]EJH0105719.1 transketolase [Campylobacter coli]ELX9412102.1 transketolase [Campylobacter coli]